jgi:carbon monoxide dehydrogenase subunit G
MPKFERSIEVSAPREKVWEVVSDVDNEPLYWHGTKSVKNRSKEGNVIDREIVQNFMNTRIVQRVTLTPGDSVRVDYVSGTTVGTKNVALESLDESRQVVRVNWDVKFRGVLFLATPFIGRHVVRGTVNALERIKEVAEGGAPGGPWPEEHPRE